MAAAILNFLSKFRKGTSCEQTENDVGNIRNPIYYTAEFQSFGDVSKDNLMGKDEFIRLMQLLGYPGDTGDARLLWKAMGQPEDGRITLNEYNVLMSDEAVAVKTDTWRKLFAEFDPDSNGYATKAEVINGLKHIGVEITPEIREKLEAMDANKDGRISYAEFLRLQLF
uniref:EF-hand domain-containing protein n=1 Tax=Arion vulgaris TaxID=1028688 RepID=A0A0B6ZRE4_9EUPU